MSDPSWWLPVGWGLVGAGLGAQIARRTAHPDLLGQPGAPLGLTTSVLATATLFELTALRFRLGVDTLAISSLVLIGVRLVLIDVARHELPRALVLPMYPILLALLGLAATTDGRYSDLARATGGMIVLLAVYLAIALLSQGGMGAGDIRLAGPVGLVLAWQSWAAVFRGTVLAFIFGGVMALAVSVGRDTREAEIPFGPAMLGGAYTAMLWH